MNGRGQSANFAVVIRSIQCVLFTSGVFTQFSASASETPWVTATPLPDRSLENQRVIRTAKYPVHYLCSVDDTTDELGHLTVTRYLQFDGRNPSSSGSWDGGAFDPKMPIGGMLRLGAVWHTDQNGNLDISDGRFRASWQMSPPVGSPSNPPDIFLVDGAGRRLQLASAWPAGYNKPRSVTAIINWSDVIEAARLPGDLVLTVQAPSEPPARRMSIDAILPKVATAIMRLDQLVKAGAHNFKSRCRATEQVPMN